MSISSTKKALDKYMAKEAKKASPRRKREPRKSPEKQVEKEVKDWLTKQGFFYTVVEAKASTSHNKYGMRAVSAGFPDIVGCTPQGRAVFIELKSPANKNGLSRGQYEFLSGALKKQAFAVHTWSVDDLSFKYSMFLAGERLDKFLPEKFKDDGGPLFGNELDTEENNDGDQATQSTPKT